MKQILLALGVITLFCGQNAHSKNLEGRFGLGSSYQSFKSLASVSARYHLSPYFTANLLVGFETGDLPAQAAYGIKLFRNLAMEENLNFFWGAGLSVLSERNAAGTQTTGIQADLLIGSEFFLTGLPSLSFLFETGIALRALQLTTLRSVGGGVMNVAIHYYF